MQFFKDLLKVKDPEKAGESQFSQSRVYLFACVIVLITMAVLSLCNVTTNKNYEIAIETIFWATVFFASYALVSKGLKYKHLKDLMKHKPEIDLKP